MHLLTRLGFLLIICGFCGCQTRKASRRSQTPIFPSAPKEAPKTSESPKISAGFHVVAAESPVLTPEQLLILRANIATTSLGGEKVGRLQFATVQGADYVAWQACPQWGDQACLSGQGLFTEVFWGVFPPGPYTVVLHACQKSQEGDRKGDVCGPIYSLDWVQPEIVDRVKGDAIERAYQIETQLKIYGRQITQIGSQLSQDLKGCMSKTNASSEMKAFEEVSQILTIQLDNISHLGAGFVSYGLQGITPPKVVDEMAAVLESGEGAMSGKDEVPGYTPEGFSLTSSQTLVDIQQAYTTPFVDKSAALTSVPVRDALEASSGMVKNKWEGLQDWQKGIALVSALLGGSLLSKEISQDFATFHFVGALLNLKEDPTYPCDALNKAIAELTPIRDHTFLLKSQLESLQNAFQ